MADLEIAAAVFFGLALILAFCSGELRHFIDAWREKRKRDKERKVM